MKAKTSFPTCSSSHSSSSSGSGSGLASSGSYHSTGSSSSGATHGDIGCQYDVRTRRTRKSKGTETRDYYHDSQWRTIGERVAGSVAAQYVWSPLDRWTMIRRKRGGEEPYVLKDHLDPAAIIDTGGTVVERFGYDAFGPARFMDAAFATLPASNADWNFLFHAEFLDTDSGLYNYGYRYYNQELGRWISRDPIGEEGGINLYGLVGNDGVNYFDILGLVNAVDAANEAIKDGKDCGCYKISGKFSQYETWSNPPDGGVKANVSITATPTNKDGCACDCKEVKVIQFVKTSGVTLQNFRHRRTAANGWRIDATEHNPRPFVSDTGHGRTSGLTGSVTDPPGNRRISGGNNKMTFTAMTCIVCADPKATDGKKVLGCVIWGYSMTRAGEGAVGAKNVTPLRPSLACGESQAVQNVVGPAVGQWNKVEGNVKVGDQLFAD